MTNIVEVKVPDIGDFKGIPVIEVLVAVGDAIKVDDSLVTLESDKATMDVPSSVAGVVTEIRLKTGDLVSEGTVVAMVEVLAGASPPVAAASTPLKEAATATPAPTPAASAAAPVPATPVAVAAMPKAASVDGPVAAPTELTGAPPRLHMPTPGELAAEAMGGTMSHASPSVRRFARELGVDVSRVTGSGPKGRIMQEDVQTYVKGVMSGAASTSGVASAPTGATSGVGMDLLPWPKVDFAKFGPVEAKPLSRIKKISGANLHRNWVMIPHVTQFDEADITDLEGFRVAMNKENEKSGIKLTMLAFLIKASVAALKKFPDFNSSLDGHGDEQRLMMKSYFNIGFAADTPNGLVVPVIKNADQKGVGAIATEMGELAKKARDGKMGPADMQGGCFSISSLGGIGGTAFTPIINAPEVAILGVSKTQTKAVWDGKQFVPRQMLPMSLSYDHRVIDGASAARFTSYLSALLADMRRVML